MCCWDLQTGKKTSEIILTVQGKHSEEKAAAHATVSADISVVSSLLFCISEAKGLLKALSIFSIA